VYFWDTGEIREAWFNTSDAASNADTWHDFGGGATENLIYTLTLMAGENLYISAAHRSDGDRIILFTGEDVGTMHGENYETSYMREEGAGWSGPFIVTPDTATTGEPDFNSAAGDAVLAESDTIWFSFMDADDNELKMRDLNSSNTLGTVLTEFSFTATQYDDEPLGQHLAYYDDAGVERVIATVQLGTNERALSFTFDDGSRENSLNVDGSNATNILVGFPLSVLNKTVYVLTSLQSDDDIRYYSSVDDAAWSAATVIETGTFIAQRININIYSRDGANRLAYIIEDDSNVREYNEIDLDAGIIPLIVHHRKQMAVN